MKDKVIDMWIFMPGGLLMPAAVPMDKVDAKWTNGGEWNLQVRARTLSHLTNFIRDYMTEGDYSEIQSTPEMDYNYRFYTSKKAFATGMAMAMLEIDYYKFKPTAEDTYEDGTLKYMDGKEYHSVLNSIWGTVCRLGLPGGKWAKGGSAWDDAISKYSGKRYGEARSNRDWLDAYNDMLDSRGRWEDSTEEGTSQVPLGDDSVWQEETEHHGMTEFAARWLEDDDYEPDSHTRKEMILAKVEDLPASQWDDWLYPDEMEIVSYEYQKALVNERERARRFRESVQESVKTVGKDRKKNRKPSKASRQTVRRTRHAAR